LAALKNEEHCGILGMGLVMEDGLGIVVLDDHGTFRTWMVECVFRSVPFQRTIPTASNHFLFLSMKEQDV